eukprot:2027360-Pyramimonas_sp.AAC.2
MITTATTSANAHKLLNVRADLRDDDAERPSRHPLEPLRADLRDDAERPSKAGEVHHRSVHSVQQHAPLEASSSFARIILTQSVQL